MVEGIPLQQSCTHAAGDNDSAGRPSWAVWGLNKDQHDAHTGALEEITMQLGARPKFSGAGRIDENEDEK